jgi:hypothetical protein
MITLRLPNHKWWVRTLNLTCHVIKASPSGCGEAVAGANLGFTLQLTPCFDVSYSNLSIDLI